MTSRLLKNAIGLLLFIIYQHLHAIVRESLKEAPSTSYRWKRILECFPIYFISAAFLLFQVKDLSHSESFESITMFWMYRHFEIFVVNQQLSLSANPDWIFSSLDSPFSYTCCFNKTKNRRNCWLQGEASFFSLAW